MATLGGQSVQIGVKRSIGIRRSPLPIDGLTPPTMQIAHSLSALVCMLIFVWNQVIFFLEEYHSSSFRICLYLFVGYFLFA